MFYIEKNDKPNKFEKIFSIIKIENNTIKLPCIITDDQKE